MGLWRKELFVQKTVCVMNIASSVAGACNQRWTVYVLVVGLSVLFAVCFQAVGFGSEENRMCVCHNTV